MVSLAFFSPYSPESPYLASVVAGANKNSYAPLVQCTSHMCPIRIHWHVKLNYKEYWRVKVTITNFNYRMNYSQWNLVVQHPNLDNLTQIFSFKYKPLTPYAAISKCCRKFYMILFGLYIIGYLGASMCIVYTCGCTNFLVLVALEIEPCYAIPRSIDQRKIVKN